MGRGKNGTFVWGWVGFLLLVIGSSCSGGFNNPASSFRGCKSSEYGVTGWWDGAFASGSKGIDLLGFNSESLYSISLPLSPQGKAFSFSSPLSTFQVPIRSPLNFNSSFTAAIWFKSDSQTLSTIPQTLFQLGSSTNFDSTQVQYFSRISRICI